jgi:hypothetical protein
MSDAAPDILGSFLESNDGLSRLAQVFARTAGRELAPEALQCIEFLDANGSGDLVLSIMDRKQYQINVDDLTKFTDKLSMATAFEKQVEVQSKAMQSMRQ